MVLIMSNKEFVLQFLQIIVPVVTLIIGYFTPNPYFKKKHKKKDGKD